MKNEAASLAPRNLDAVTQACERGLRSVMPAYNGVDVVSRCHENGLIVDISHCGHMTRLVARKFSRRPVNANHIGATRGKDDDVHN